ncbi:hypothetical protein ACP70R_028522 [Stipagrostis hirtigluma subsp. patula]
MAYPRKRIDRKPGREVARHVLICRLECKYVVSLLVSKNEIGERSIFDCVDIYEQPSLRHPLLVNHTIQLKFDKALYSITSASSKMSASSRSTQESCPLGTVPIKRVTSRPDLSEMRNHARYINLNSYNQMLEEEHNITNNYHAMVLVNPKKGKHFYGAEALMDVYRIPGIKNDQISNGQIIVIKGKGGPRNYVNTVQVGWTAYYQLNGDVEPRFFVAWTSDDYQHTGCIDTLCEGYIQVSHKIFPGMQIWPAKGSIKLRLYRDPATSNWLIVSEGDGGYDLIGYFAHEMFNNMNDADEVQVGGVTFAPTEEHMVPAMGSGRRPGESGDVCTFTEVAMLDGGGKPEAWGLFHAYVGDRWRHLYDCSDPKPEATPNVYSVAFGGPGGDRYA